MTGKMLSEIPYIRGLIEDDEEKIARLRSRITSGVCELSGMPGGGGTPKNVLEEITVQITEIEARIKRRKLELRAREGYIYRVTDRQVQLIMVHHYINRLTWRQTARKIGGNNTADSVRMTCKRYLSEN